VCVCVCVNATADGPRWRKSELWSGGGIVLAGERGRNETNPVPVLLCSLHIPHDSPVLEHGPAR
jgi:hypothetical protein